MQHIKPIPIGVEFYQEMIEEEYYYIDKTLLIRDLLVNKNKVTVFTRPRRFGKTLAQSMLKAFFEKKILPDGTVADNSVYFQGKKIMEAGVEYTRHMGQYPVIFLSLKSAKQPTYEMAYENLTFEIRKEYDRHRYILENDNLTEEDKKIYQSILAMEAGNTIVARAIAFLSECLEKYHKHKVIILLDEYDVPLENAYFAGFYQEMTVFVRSVMESALKTNEDLKFAVITGCLRVSRESIFTGLNNLNVISILSDSFAECFGFTRHEVADLLTYYELEDKAEEVQEWYDGYLFGKTEVYNPWSVTSYLNGIIADKIEYPRPYWANTSSNGIIRELIENAGEVVRAELEDLMSQKSIVKPIHEDITYEDINSSSDNLWNFLLLTGYLKAVDSYFDGMQAHIMMAVPNREVRYIYERNIMEWLKKRSRMADFTDMYHAMLEGDADAFENLLRSFLKRSISFYDEKETFYHGFLIGVMNNLEGYRTLSNRETGDGRADLILKPFDEHDPAIIFELKYTKDSAKLDQKCGEALRQIKERSYADELAEDEYNSIIKYGICFCKKNCRVKCNME